MVVNIYKYLNPVATLLKVKLDNTKSDKAPNSTIINTVFTLLNKSNSALGPSNDLERVEIQQWIEYVLVYASHVDNVQNSKIVLKELNDVLALKTYLVSHRLTIADVLLFYVLVQLMDSLSTLEKEKYLHVCRWFDNLQQDESLRQKNKVVDFSSNFLATLVPARH
ncbi:unnamed protein product [Diabrotica balteata]|uniref:GST C-terminal domain-containing protein n=1 Tax=Diabrotica balteata TaxID=107213 RepID=A0A9N9STX0_DIABA|nr:unnamed protein product [Diabrotica balteata]